MNGKNNHRMITVSCQVCGVETSRRIRCSAFVCEACKRFFMRHRSMATMTLRCENGDNQCIARESKLKMSEKGIIWRNLCPACRFAKCISIGMNSTQGKERQEVAGGSSHFINVPTHSPTTPVNIPAVTMANQPQINSDYNQEMIIQLEILLFLLSQGC